MAEITLDFRPSIDGRQLEALEEALDQLGPDDTMRIVVERHDAHELDPVLRLLNERGLGYQPKGGHDDNYYLYVSPRLTQPRGPEPPEPFRQGSNVE